jgi:hypothetical protein
MADPSIIALLEQVQKNNEVIHQRMDDNHCQATTRHTQLMNVIKRHANTSINRD